MTAFTEAGACIEFLGEEMGIYRDPYELFGRYSYEMWRACRLVADTGIHWLGWDIEQARRCFTDNSALSAQHPDGAGALHLLARPGARVQGRRAALPPVRREAEQALGERFNIRQFHDTLLLGGPLPLDLVQERVREMDQEESRVTVSYGD